MTQLEADLITKLALVCGALKALTPRDNEQLHAIIDESLALITCVTEHPEKESAK
jgi:hypothetical protein